MSHDTDDSTDHHAGTAAFHEIVAQRRSALSRRDVLRGGIGIGALSWIGAGGAAGLGSGCDDGSKSPATPDAGTMPDAAEPPQLGFAAVAKSLADTVTVPAGYHYAVLYSLGDPIAAGVPAYANDGSDPAASFPQRSGDHHDGMHFFGLDGNGHAPGSSDRGLLCINHEGITPLFLHPLGPTVVADARTVPEEVQREFFLHGVSVIEVARANGTWSYVQPSPFNRRIHALTEVEIGGPLRGTPAMVTPFSPDGTRARGTLNNCANGYTPWGTYLTCEENWAEYFRRIAADDDPRRTTREIAALARYRIAGAGRLLWSTVAPDTEDQQYGRWNAMVRGATAVDDYRNEANTFGWVVEIDPFSGTSAPKKRTAIGRFAHEGAWPATAVAGKPLVFYAGDDSRGEYIYKYVSRAPWDPADAARTDRLSVGDKYLDDGTLYAARFAADGTGTWLELAFGKNGITGDHAAYAFADQADVLLHARLAADAAGATRMDRPEWGAVDPATGAVYMSLTNNNASVRTLAATDAANPRHYNDPKAPDNTAQLGNPNGHIIRWKEPSPEATTFTWDIFLFGASSDADPANVNVSGLTADNDFSSPDGLWFSRKTQICWIETDDAAYTDVSHCMLLAALPGSVGDGAARTITSTDQAGESKQVTTHVGKPPGDRLRRFLVGPSDCEITGLAESPDGAALFVNIQHPGESSTRLDAPLSTWPSGSAGARPRSSTIVITRDGGGVIGLKAR